MNVTILVRIRPTLHDFWAFCMYSLLLDRILITFVAKKIRLWCERENANLVTFQQILTTICKNSVKGGQNSITSSQLR